ncbi:MAG: M15 family metallopeptidase [Akkermansiaceae bacterium]
MTNESRELDLANLPQSKNPILAKAGLISIHEVDPTIGVDLQYKNPTSITKSPLYPKNFPALLKPETAVRLKHANAFVKERGMKIVIWDAYRPPSAQMKLWDASGHNDTYVANPGNAPSQHSCGTAVDVTIVSLNDRPVKMPTEFDAFKPEAASNFHHPDLEIRQNLYILKSAMSRAGFYPLPAEWWHHIDKSYKKYPDTITLDKIRGSY